MDNEYQPTLRDRIVVKLANFVLSFASKRYQDFLEGSIRYGMNSAVRDELEGKERPPDWESYGAR